MIQAEHHRAEPEAVPDQEPRRVTIDICGTRASATGTRAAAIAPPPIRTSASRAGSRGAPCGGAPAAIRRAVPAGISPARAVDLMEATAADACALKQRARQQALAHPREVAHADMYVLLAPDPPADEPAVIHEAVDVLRAGELQAAIVRGADDDGPCTTPSKGSFTAPATATPSCCAGTSGEPAYPCAG